MPLLAPAGLATDEQVATLGRLIGLLHALPSALDLDAAVCAFLEALRAELDLDVAAFLVLDDRGETLRVQASSGLPPEVAASWRLGLGQGLAGRAARDARVATWSAGDPKAGLAGDPLAADAVAAACLPLVHHERVIGVLEVARAAGRLPAAELGVLGALAPGLATAVEQARVFAGLRREAETLALLHEASRHLAGILDRGELLRRVGQLLRRLVAHRYFHVFLWNEERQQLETIFVAGHDRPDVSITLPLGIGVCGTAAALRQTLRVPDVSREPRFRSCGMVTVKSELAAPMVVEDRLVGVLDLESDQIDAFCASDERLLGTLAATVAIALENVRLVERLREDEARLARDLETARRVQAILLPKRTPWVPGLQIAVGYRSARHLGGDLYDVTAYDDQRTLVVLGDVAGKGTGAALYGSLTLGLLRGFAADNRCGPLCLFSYLDEALRDLKVEHRFVALAAALYDHRDGTLTVANAGVPWPLLVRGGEVREIRVGGVPLGAMRDATWSEEILALAPGDVLVLASDGVEEGRNATAHPYGADRLHATLRTLANRPADEIADGVLADTDAFLGGREASDDRTVVVLRVGER